MKRTIEITTMHREHKRCLAVSMNGTVHWGYTNSSIFDCNYSGQRRPARVRQFIKQTVTLDESALCKHCFPPRKDN